MPSEQVSVPPIRGAPEITGTVRFVGAFAATAAETIGVFDHYVDEIYRHMWAEPKKMDDPAVFRAALAASPAPAANTWNAASSLARAP